MVLSRRDLMINVGSLFAVAGAPRVARGAHTLLPVGIGVIPDYTGPLPPSRLGTQRPASEEEREAMSIINRAPYGPTPIDVARYFLDLANGVYGVNLKPYASGWPTRWNPVIVSFFRATNTTPSGDLTPWCAAFLNWCYLRATNAPATGSASSGSFRCYSAPTDSPHVGDVVVFRRKDSNNQCGGNGHVGFFIRQTGSSVEVLGGNQIEGQTGCHSISSKAISKQGSVLTLHSYRRAYATANHNAR